MRVTGPEDFIFFEIKIKIQKIILQFKRSIGSLLRSQPGERPVNIIYLWDFL